LAIRSIFSLAAAEKLSNVLLIFGFQVTTTFMSFSPSCSTSKKQHYLLSSGTSNDEFYRLFKNIGVMNCQ
jgi:hypothetical protein